jgi:hypothetical protein
MAIAEVLKLWGPPPLGGVVVPLGGVGFLYEGHIYFEISMGAT